MNKALGFTGSVLAGIVLLYPLSSGPAERFYLHAYKKGTAIVIPQEFFYGRGDTFDKIYEPLFNRYKVVDQAIYWYWLLWLGNRPENVPQPN